MSYVKKVTDGEHARREANWRRSKMGRAVLRRRCRPSLELKTGTKIRAEIEEKRQHRTFCRSVGLGRSVPYRARETTPT